MSRRYNVKHDDRGRSNYKKRLEARGLNRPPKMRDVEDLRNMQDARVRRQGHPWPKEVQEQS